MRSSYEYMNYLQVVQEFRRTPPDQIVNDIITESHFTEKCPLTWWGSLVRIWSRLPKLVDKSSTWRKRLVYFFTSVFTVGELTRSITPFGFLGFDGQRPCQAVPSAVVCLDL
jgi:hypothetical protein